ncbi:CHAP domain-containing protein [Acidocella sp.]|uniref:CHAP domain-containing protein n=1 Tax=Acidocella sp. TaxID=50710 RepID=UPI00260A3C83|nr:CHAP domain-containing protein [Acidocella sp.]
MIRPSALLVLGLSVWLCACAGRGGMEPASRFGQPTRLTCVPYARDVSGIDLSGNAYSWWDEAAGVYPRSQSPEVGAVLVFRPHGDMRVGHLAVVSRVKTSREILVSQANWLPRRIERDVPVVDVSACNDWTRVRVWYEPAHALGVTRYPTYGFILPNG